MSETKQGKFLSVWIAGETIWIEDCYQMAKPTDEQFAHWSNRDVYEWSKQRKLFIERADIIEIADMTYVVVFNCDISDEQKLKIAEYHHNKLTVKVRFDNE